ncbi:MAG: 50S ribosomal protein L11 methyltransferase [Prevotella sp.]|nr:50S ribosomal protein L11 methyltransferase [Prevotella sp.]
MKYYAVNFKIACEDLLMQICRDLLADMAADVGFESFEDTEDGVVGYVQTELFHSRLLDEGISSFPVEGVKIEYEVTKAESQDWNEAWEQEGFDPIIIDGRCIIYDARKQGDTQLSKHIAPLRIAIEARMAFGTGTHETTRMIVAKLLDLPIEGKRVLDCGCGTGILSIVASKLGAKSVVAYDIDEWSVENTQHNASINGVNNISVLQGDSSVLSHVSGMFDFVLANINRNILLADMKVFVELIHTHGTLIISGFYEEDVPILSSHAETLGLKLISVDVQNNWSCCVLTKEA